MAAGNAKDLLEAAAVECLGDDSPTTIQLSIAISLKRIADAMTTDPCNEYGETFVQAIYGGIARGLRDGRP